MPANQDHQVTTLQATPVATPEANKVSGAQHDATPWGRYLLELAHGYSRETAMHRADISPTQLGLARSEPGMEDLERAAMRSGTIGDTTELTQLVAKANSLRYLRVVDRLADGAQREETQLKAARTGLEVTRQLGAQGAQASGPRELDLSAYLLQVNVTVNQGAPPAAPNPQLPGA